ncbi:MAG: LytTR family DNA-binding domain-containing protein [Myxococcota bacterium]
MTDASADSDLRVALADDELIARKRATRLLEALPGVTVVGAFASADELLARIAEGDVDVVLLDIQMPGLSGLDAHALLPEDGPEVIFATAHPEHAVEAFELGAADYVLKPIEAGRLGKAIERVRARQALATRPEGETLAVRPNRIPVSTRDGIVLVDPVDVSHAVFDGSLVTLHTNGGDAHLVDGTLQDLQGRLPDDRFERVHRRALVNLREVALLKPTETGGYVAETKRGGQVPVSRQSARKLRRWLGL